MTTRLTLLACAVLLLGAPAVAGADALIEIPAGAPPTAGVELTGHASGAGAGAIASDAGLAALRAAGVPARVLVADLAARDRSDRAADAAYAARVGSSPLPSGRTTYRRLGDFEADLDRLAAERPDLVRRIDLDPPTLEGRRVRGIEITRDVGRRDGKPVMLHLGLHHAREWPSGELPMEFAFDLVRGDGRDPRISALLERVRVVIVPVVNPDGFTASRDAPADTQDPVTSQIAGLVQNGTSYRRKNCRAAGQSGLTQPPTPCAAAPGVDLNRNYGINWGGNGASSFEPSPDFRGAGPFSEPESEAVRRLVSSRQVTLLITNHTFGDQVLRPPGVRSIGAVPDEPALRALGARMAAQNGYRNERSWELYDNSGTTEDWSYGITGGFGYTFEIGSENFHPPYEDAVVGEYLGQGASAGRGNREAYLLALEHAADPAGHAVLEGFAPAGRLLRVRRAVAATTSPVCVTQPTGFFSTPCPATGEPRAFADRLESAREVGGDGVVAWHLNPSAAVFGEDSGAWELTCEAPGGRVLERRQVRLSRGATVKVALSCGEPPCRVTRVLDAVAAMPARRGRAVRLGARLRRGVPARTRVRADVLRVATGRRAVRAALVRRIGSLPRTGTVLAGRGLRPGAYVVRFSAGRDVRRVAFVVGGRDRVRRGPRFAAPDGCGELRTARLASPVFGGPGDVAARLVVRLAADATVRVRLAGSGRTIARLSRVVPGGRDVALRLPGAALPAGAYTVHLSTVRGTPAARRASARTLRVRGL